MPPFAFDTSTVPKFSAKSKANTAKSSPGATVIFASLKHCTMKFTITGSLGNISKPLTGMLCEQGHIVTVVSSDPAKKTAIEAQGAKAVIGSISDPVFLTNAFMGADAVYAMIPMSFTEADVDAYMHRMADSYVEAIKAALTGFAANGAIHDVHNVRVRDTEAGEIVNFHCRAAPSIIGRSSFRPILPTAIFCAIVI